jgi:hypothetical protein
MVRFDITLAAHSGSENIHVMRGSSFRPVEHLVLPICWAGGCSWFPGSRAVPAPRSDADYEFSPRSEWHRASHLFGLVPDSVQDRNRVRQFLARDVTA